MLMKNIDSCYESTKRSSIWVPTVLYPFPLMILLTLESQKILSSLVYHPLCYMLLFLSGNYNQLIVHFSSGVSHQTIFSKLSTLNSNTHINFFLTYMGKYHLLQYLLLNNSLDILPR